MSSALTLQQEAALAAAIAELRGHYDAARATLSWSVWFDSDGLDNARASLNGAKAALALLEGPLLEAARGFRAWPLDEPTAKFDPQGALGAWLQLADSVRAAVDGVKGYTAKWSALETLKTVGADVGQNIATGTQFILIAAALVALAFLASKVAR